MQDKSNVPVTKLTRQQQREYRRDHSTLRESLHALSQELADGSRQINQYHILKPLGQGSFGAVYLGENRGDVNHFVAVKEFGKLRLRHNLRISSHRLTQFPEQRNATLRKENEEDPLFLVRTEIAIMKKLLHPNVIKLFEVLDDSDSEKLYMVFEYCPGGILIDVSPGKQVIPMTEDQARKSFVQILSGIDYLHNNGIVHRDIKPDNILFNEDRTVCKIVDFGVSEMFCMPGDDTMKRVAGSPAFMSPELCQAGHVEWHGCSDDIWSFGVTFFAMVMGRLPFDKKNVIELYESIQKDDIVLGEQLSPECCDLLLRMLDKREEHRITTDELYIHPWVTRNGLDHVPTLEEVNNSHVVREVTDEDVHSAISRISSVFTVARAVYKFKHHSMTRASSELMCSNNTVNAACHSPSPSKPDSNGSGEHRGRCLDPILDVTSATSSTLTDEPMQISPTSTLQCDAQDYSQKLVPELPQNEIVHCATPDAEADTNIICTSPSGI